MALRFHFECRMCHRTTTSGSALRYCSRCMEGVPPGHQPCQRCRRTGVIGLFAPDGWLAGEVLWTFLEFLIERECPKCGGSGSVRIDSPIPGENAERVEQPESVLIAFNFMRFLGDSETLVGEPSVGPFTSPFRFGLPQINHELILDSEGVPIPPGKAVQVRVFGGNQHPQQIFVSCKTSLGNMRSAASLVRLGDYAMA